MQDNQISLESTVTCPNCAFQKTEMMPTDSCLWYYECSACKTLLKPKPGDCCVFCSYGTVACPSIQEKSSLCCNTADNPPA